MRSRISFIALLLAMLIGACGGSEGDDQDPEPTQAGDSSADTTITTASADSSEEAESTQTTSAPEGEDAAEAGAGAANLVIGDMTFEFSGLTCYFDDAAAEASGDEDVTFGATAQDGDEVIGIQLSDMGLELFEVGYTSGDSTFWAMAISRTGDLMAGGEYSIEDGQITAEGEFEYVVDSEVTETAPGSLNASCG